MDPVDELVTQVSQWRQRIRTLKSKESDTLQKRCRQKASHAKKLKSKLTELLQQAARRVKEARELVRNSIISEKNTDGFLMGQVDDYIKDYEGFVNQANAQIDKDVQSWLTEAKLLDQDKEKRLQSM